MPGTDSGRNPVEQLAEEFVERYRRGEFPALSEYTGRYPQWADEIRDLFPALVAMERLKPAAGDETGAGGGAAGGGRAPERLGDYRIVREVGRGGMGVVYEAEQLSLGRRVALKVLPPGLLDGQRVQRFRREAKAVARLHHTNIVPVFGVGEAEGLHYYAMQFIPGQGLDQVLEELRRLRPAPTAVGSATPAGPAAGAGAAAAAAQSLLTGCFAGPGAGPPAGGGTSGAAGPSPAAPATSSGGSSTAVLAGRPERLALSEAGRAYWQGVARLGLQAAEALDYAHRQGLVHRDVKPSNLLLDAQGTVWVTDFGLAKADDSDDLTHSGDVVGTLRYLAPERFEGKADARSDVYALGLTLYELLTLRPAFDAPDRNRLVRQVMAEEPPRPRRLNPGVPRDLETVVLKATERDPTRRYPTAAALADDLRRFLADEPVRARRAGPLERLWRWGRRHRAVAALTAAVALLLLGGAVGGLVLSLHLWAALDQAREADREKTDKLWWSHYERARAGRFSRQMGQRLDSLAALEEAARIRPDERLRDEAIAALALPDVRRGPSWQAFPPGVKAVAFDDAYRLYARAEDQGTISIRSIPDDKPIRSIATSPPVLTGSLWLSPDGQFVAKLEGGYTLRVWRVADGQPVLSEAPSSCWGLAFSPDGRHLAVGQQGWVRRYDLATGQETNRWRLPARAHSLVFHPDNRKLAVGYSSSTVASVYNAVEGTLLADLPVGPVSDQVLAWHPDGNRLAVSGSDPRVQVWNVAAKRRLATLEGHVQHVTVLSFHPDGELLASAGWEGVLRLWHPSSGRQLMQLPLKALPQFSRDGRWLGVAYHGEQAQLLEVVPTREYRTLVSSEGANRDGYYYGDISPDGRLLVLGMQTSTRLWDLSSGREVARLPGGSQWAFFDRVGPRWELLTNGSAGLQRWPVRDEDKGLRLGPPRQLSPLSRADFTRDPEGRTLAAVYEAGLPIQVLDLERGVVRQKLAGHPDGDGPHALSPDGRWLASCGWHSDRVRLWNVQTGAMVREWILGVQTFVAFTPDSRTLIISRGDEFSFWDVDGGQLVGRLRRDVPVFPGRVAFSADGQLMALEMAPAVIHLQEVATGRTVAKLEDPHGDRAGWMGFTPDGTQLVVVAGYAKAIHVWDLRAIRTRLKEMDLDWDWPEFPPAPAPAAVQAVPAVTVDAGYLQHAVDFPDSREAVALLSVSLALHPLNPEALLQRGRAFGQLKQAPQAVGDYSLFLALAPPDDPRRAEVLFRRSNNHQQLRNDAAALADLLEMTRLDVRDVPWPREVAVRCNNAAWGLLAGPEKDRQPDRALSLALKAVELSPGDPIHRNSLGVAYYRLGRWRDAAATLEANLADNAEYAAFDLYFLAMSYHQLQDPARARDYFERAARWHDEKGAGLPESHRTELSAFRAEAEALLRPR